LLLLERELKFAGGGCCGPGRQFPQELRILRQFLLYCGSIFVMALATATESRLKSIFQTAAARLTTTVTTPDKLYLAVRMETQEHVSQRIRKGNAVPLHEVAQAAKYALNNRYARAGGHPEVLNETT
jgi:hypothetical protein